jgi:hypothetical protein
LFEYIQTYFIPAINATKSTPGAKQISCLEYGKNDASPVNSTDMCRKITSDESLPRQEATFLLSKSAMPGLLT